LDDSIKSLKFIFSQQVFDLFNQKALERQVKVWSKWRHFYCHWNVL